MDTCIRINGWTFRHEDLAHLSYDECRAVFVLARAEHLTSAQRHYLESLHHDEEGKG